MPVEYGPWGRIYDLFRRWQRNGTWHQVLTRLQALADAKGAIVWDLSVDDLSKTRHDLSHAALRVEQLQARHLPLLDSAVRNT
ncbi:MULTISPECIES: transposase [Streptomyces]|uniref:Transposase n=1 Tax=Streptomyces nigrescens TaxID=1920 RepID=A0ABY7ITG6_STRNI|nr:MULTISPECIES: transposase [Streptomyces]WAU02093.1 transposase [Streptomyces nigrescens]